MRWDRQTVMCSCMCFFFFQAEDGIRDLVRSRGLGDVYKRQQSDFPTFLYTIKMAGRWRHDEPES